MTYTDLQNGLYNLLQQAMGFAPGTGLQLIQPAIALPSSTSNAALWSYMNDIPPFSLARNYTNSGGDQFFSNYEALMSALVPAVNLDFEAAIGTAVYQQWLAYVNSLPDPPAVMQLPNLFLNWASSTHPAVAVTGASDLSALILEPIHQAQLALMPYVTIPSLVVGKAPDWTSGYPQLAAQLARAPGKQATSASLQANANVSGSWTRGAQTESFGLWRGSANNTAQSTLFASQAVSLSFSCSHLTIFTPAPGPWFSSAAFGIASSAQSGSPWNPNSAINWQETFGSSGNMQRLVSSLVVASGIRMTASTTARFSAADQAIIHQNAAAGLWPFYAAGGSTFSTSHSFNAAGQLAIASSSPEGVPILLAVDVLTTGQYSGHAMTGLRLFSKLSGIDLLHITALPLAAHLELK